MWVVSYRGFDSVCARELKPCPYPVLHIRRSTIPLSLAKLLARMRGPDKGRCNMEQLTQVECKRGWGGGDGGE